MTRRSGARGTMVLMAICVGLATSVRAHRLDEYLQASRIALGRASVTIELDLTPGAAIAPVVFAMIDGDRNGAIADREAEQYLGAVVEALEVSVDGQAVKPRLVRYSMPDWGAVVEGRGSMRLTASAALTEIGPGAHQLLIRNVHRSDIGVYLANALVPDDTAIEISTQRRDDLQHELTIEYRVRATEGDPAMWSVAAAVLLLVAVGVVASGRRSKRDVC